MPRPKKNPEDRKSYHLRVPLNEAERKAIARAVELDGEDMAGWSRRVLLAAAHKRIGKAQGGSEGHRG